MQHNMGSIIKAKTHKNERKPPPTMSRGPLCKVERHYQTVFYVCIILFSAKCASKIKVSPPSAYEQVTYNIEDWEIDIKFYEWTVFIELEMMNYFYFVLGGLTDCTELRQHLVNASSLPVYVATRCNWDLTSRMHTLENISSGGVISDNMH